MQDYEKLAIRTENTDYAGIANRLEKHADKIMPALNQAILALQQLDYVVKKECFYGKTPQPYQAPQFANTIEDEQRDVLHSKTFIRLLHGFMGMATETGEGLEALAQFFNTGKLDKTNLGEELGDCFWYAALIAEECQTSFELEQEKNIRKLAHRHGEKFSDVKVMDRDLEGERNILEQP
ncbi:MAG: MazG nucleotide pyrophosphohydrolase domain-containing protein [Oligoflexus sp.]